MGSRGLRLGRLLRVGVDFWTWWILACGRSGAPWKEACHIWFIEVWSEFGTSHIFRWQKVEHWPGSGADHLRLVGGSREIAGDRVGYASLLEGDLAL